MNRVFHFRSSISGFVCSVGVLLSSTAFATEASELEKIARLVEEARTEQSCRGVQIYINCFGARACREVLRQKQEAIDPFESAGLVIHPVQNYWLQVMRDNGRNELSLLPYNPRTASLEPGPKPVFEYFGAGARNCLGKLGIAINVSVRAGAHWYGSMILARSSPLVSTSNVIIYDWANPNQVH